MGKNTGPLTFETIINLYTYKFFILCIFMFIPNAQRIDFVQIF